MKLHKKELLTDYTRQTSIFIGAILAVLGFVQCFDEMRIVNPIPYSISGLAFLMTGVLMVLGGFFMGLEMRIKIHVICSVWMVIYAIQFLFIPALSGFVIWTLIALMTLAKIQHMRYANSIQKAVNKFLEEKDEGQ